VPHARAVAGFACWLVGVSGAPAAGVDFRRDIRPILSEHCFACHGPDAAKRQAGLRLDQEADAKGKLPSGRRAVVAGEPASSELLRRIGATEPAQRMPPAWAGREALPERERALLGGWIEQGARWETHWSFVAPRKPEPPAVRQREWVRNPIDAFVLQRLEREGLRPSPEADRATLIRRVTLDLTGLPPTPEETDAFLKDASRGAWEKLVDRLLGSPRYAERMAVRWLEAARYADTNGYQSDGERSMWRWRDWVIDAFGRNLPFDRFTIAQIAGDMLPRATLEETIATGFHRNHRTSAEGGIVEEEFRVEYVADRVETTATVWLGLTAGCARCHDHKYDPLTQKEFYRLFAYFNNVPERGLVYNFGNEEPYVKAPTPEHLRRLEELDSKAAAAAKRWAGLQPRLAKLQASWERQLPQAEPLDWTISDGLVTHVSGDSAEEKTGGCAEAGLAPGCHLEQAPGRVGMARAFDGRRFLDAGDKANFSYLDPFTVAAWVNPAAGTGAIVSRTEEWLEGEGWAVYLMDGKVRLHITRRWTDISLRVETVEPVALDRWQHIAVTYDGYRKAAGVRIYVDGSPRKLKVLFDELTYPFGAKEPLRIGAGGGPKFHFRGLIDEVRVFKTALEPQQAAVLGLLETMNEIAALKPAARTPAHRDKLAFCYLDRFAPEEMRKTRREMLDARRERERYFESIPTVMVMRESATPRPAFVLKRGAYDAPGERVSPGAPAFLPPLDPRWPNNRLGLARWLVDRSNPLTARVTVNRLWQMLFGTGIVKTAEDFGSQGEPPSHPELLDWLACRFMDGGWDVQAMLRIMTTSAAYRQASRATPELLQNDPENRLLARGPRFRLPAEMIRDQALAVSGLLVEKVGGPPVRPYQPPGLWQELAGGRGYTEDKGEGLWRRSLYTYWKRTVAPPSMMTFDAPTRETCAVRDVRTNTPLQALQLMNDVAYMEASRKLAGRMMKEGGAAPESRIDRGFRLVLARAPGQREARLVGEAFARFRGRYGSDPKAAAELLSLGHSPRDAALDPAELAAWTAVASLLLNLDETVTKE